MPSNSKIEVGDIVIFTDVSAWPKNVGRRFKVAYLLKINGEAAAAVVSINEDLDNQYEWYLRRLTKDQFLTDVHKALADG